MPNFAQLLRDRMKPNTPQPMMPMQPQMPPNMPPPGGPPGVLRNPVGGPVGSVRGRIGKPSPMSVLAMRPMPRGY